MDDALCNCHAELQAQKAEEFEAADTEESDARDYHETILKCHECLRTEKATLEAVIQKEKRLVTLYDQIECKLDEPCGCSARS